MAISTDLSAVHVSFRCSWPFEELVEQAKETTNDIYRKVNSPSGELLIAPDDSRVVSCENLLQQLEDEGYVLVAGWMQETIKMHDSYAKPSFVINFHFSPRDQAVVTDDVAQSLKQAFTTLVTMNFWHAQVYRNPGEDAPWLSVGLATRVPRYIGDDPQKPQMRRNRNDAGEKIDGSHLLSADVELSFENSTFTMS